MSLDLKKQQIVSESIPIAVIDVHQVLETNKHNNDVLIEWLSVKSSR